MNQSHSLIIRRKDPPIPFASMKLGASADQPMAYIRERATVPIAKYRPKEIAPRAMTPSANPPMAMMPIPNPPIATAAPMIDGHEQASLLIGRRTRQGLEPGGRSPAPGSAGTHRRHQQKPQHRNGRQAMPRSAPTEQGHDDGDDGQGDGPPNRLR